MTNSETQTERRKSSQKSRGPKGRSTPEPESAGSQGDESQLVPGIDERKARALSRVTLVGLLLIGWLGILHINRWHFGPPVLFLWTGWLGVLLTARFLWTAGMTAAYDEDDMDEEEFWQPVGERDELLREKRSLLKALKEIEFDREMGKMSDKDAEELTRLYRTRAIQIIKALEAHGDDDRELTIDEKIEREVKARLSVASASAKAKASSRRNKDKANGSSKDAAKAKDDEPAAAKAKDDEPAAAKAEDEAEAEAEDDESAEARAEDDNEAAAKDAEPSEAADDQPSDSIDEADSAAGEPARARAEVGS